MSTVYTINLDYRCNEQCVFCAADLGGDVPRAIRQPSLTLDAVKAWLGDVRPGPSDRVLLSGGEPTLHRELLDVARYVSESCRDIVLFTNGLRLADSAYARATAEAGISRYEISLYGADAASHDAITRRKGSFELTVEALRVLVAMRAELDVWVTVRLLVSKDTVDRNADIVRRISADVRTVDAFSLNRVILSSDALRAGAPISWAEARVALNECARLIRSLGYTLEAAGVPLCVFEGDNASWALGETATRLRRVKAGLEPDELAHRYVDPMVIDPPSHPVHRSRSALPDICVACGVSGACMRVDRGYLRLFGPAGLRALPLSALPSSPT